MSIIDLILVVLLFISLWAVSVAVILVFAYGREFKRLWQEPMLRYPVVIFESDDWGVGPEEQVSALADLLQLFLQYQDQKQHHPVLTLGMVLAEPDVERIAEQIAEQMKLDKRCYYYRDLSDDNYRELVQIIKKGQEQNIFSIHLHGMEHFWPDSLMNSLQRDDVKQWLFGSDSSYGAGSNYRITENLPSYLQSRWCDTSTLPSVPLKGQEIEKAIETEKNCFKKVFDHEPKVVVPPTFVWTDNVIRQYSLHNIHLIVTPGRQYTGRDAKGALQSNDRTFYNGDTDQENDVLYLVRDVYFEPKMGHKADKVLTDIVSRTSCARPSLIEMHRFNFLSNKEHSLRELKHLLDSIGKQLPETLFLSAEQLADSYQSKDGTVLFLLFAERLQIWIKRVQLFLQYKRLAKYTGFNKILYGFCTPGALPSGRRLG